MSKITAYFAPWCGNCHTIIPKVKAYAKRNGIAFEKVNVDKCTTEVCESIGYVPHILMDGQPISDVQLERIVNG